MVNKWKADLLQNLKDIGECVETIHNINERLAEIALKKQPYSDTDFFDCLIQEEQTKKEQGYIKRIESYQAFKKRILIAQKADKGTLDLQTFCSLNDNELDSL